MSSSTSSPRRGGFEPSKSSDNSKTPLKLFLRPGNKYRYGAALLLAGLYLLVLTAITTADGSSFSPSKAAAEQCQAKLDRLQGFTDKYKAGQTQTTKFLESEVNSYLALDLSSQYHPCLKSLVMVFGTNHLKATAKIDFDRLGKTSAEMLPKLIKLVFSGVHTLVADGQLVAKDGKAYFKLDQALFDGTTLPKPLVEAILSAVGRKQKPPFDPLKPSDMPYKINKVTMDSGYIIVFQ